MTYLLQKRRDSGLNLLLGRPPHILRHRPDVVHRTANGSANPCCED